MKPRKGEGSPGIARFVDELRDGPQRRRREAERRALASATAALGVLSDSAELLTEATGKACLASLAFNGALAAMPKPDPWWKRWQTSVPVPFEWP